MSDTEQLAMHFNAICAAHAQAIEALLDAVATIAGPNGDELREMFIADLRTRMPASHPVGRCLHDLASLCERPAAGTN